MKPLLIVRAATSHDDLPALCARRGDEVRWFAEACGISDDLIMTVDAYKGDTFPNLDDVQGIVVTGAIDMISEDLPWMRDAEAYLRMALKAEVPIFGVCFGHQLLALAAGGSVGQNPNGAEFGVVNVHLTEHAKTDPIFSGLPTEIGAFTFHYESVLQLPDGAIPLASNEHDQHHAFRYGPNAWGTQFHPEFDEEIMDSAIDTYQQDMIDAGYDISALRSGNKNDGQGQTLLRAFAQFAFSSQSPHR